MYFESINKHYYTVQYIHAPSCVYYRRLLNGSSRLRFFSSFLFSVLDLIARLNCRAKLAATATATATAGGGGGWLAAALCLLD